ncbi:MAG: ATP synthase F0 subunit A [Chloroflexi bacterium]|nr:MAG: ATP synthase F0 subunit A [Chloroflexota bacterium]
MRGLLKPKTLGIILGVLLITIGSAVILRVPLPSIVLPPEPVTCIGGHLVHAEHGLECEGGFPLTNSMIGTLVADITLLGLVFLGLRNMSLVPRGLQNVLEAIIEAGYGVAEDVAGKENAPKFFPLAMSIFLFVLVANWWELVPGMEAFGWLVEVHEKGWEAVPLVGNLHMLVRESGHYAIVPWVRTATTDLNLPLALALITMVYVQYSGFRALGLGYLKKFINFSGPMDFFVGILESISEVAKIISFTFRLFGNIFAGTVLLFVMPFLIPLIAPLPFFGLEVFVGFIQAFIFAMLALSFLSTAVIAHDHGEH